MMQRVITISVKEEDYEEFVKFFNEDAEWDDECELEDAVYDTLNLESVDDLDSCPFCKVEDTTI
jgi:hypothetical protein